MASPESPSPKGGGYYIARDHENPLVIAVYQDTAGGRHPRVATGFKTREEADRWIKFQSVGAGQGGEAAA